MNNLRLVCLTVVDAIKNYLIAFWEFPNIDVDKRLAVGSVLMEYLYPLLLDDFLLEDQFL